MISLLAMLTAAAAQAPAAATPHTLQNLPGVTVHYYDVAGEDSDTIKKSLDKIAKAPSPNTASQVYDWAVDVAISKRTEGTTCTVTSATATLKANVYLPRLSGSHVPRDVADGFGKYEKSLETSAVDNLGFVVDRLPAIQQSLIGKPCDSVQGLWTQADDKLLADQKAFAAAHASKK